ncbi:type II CAAX prenyl endopeptidase Rce1 family protein [Flavihumibacter sp. UBA7668]|uniref:CPBP family glutamic-type intramembrane protease n=1 Tax=Flavihumibacter sp. UBA7668 TaxID=1946542 RepID=UPI0025C27610|nr:CPBP family glutamic-type intramembrane protease [Flavihumibacter sp. UBA7668]
MTEELDSANQCSACGVSLNPDDVICPQCGEPSMPSEEWEGAYERYRLMVVIFFSINLFVCLLFNFWPPAGETITGLVLVDGFLLSCGLFFAYQLWNEIKPLLRWNNFAWWRLILLILLAICAAILVNYGVKWINEKIFERELYYYSSFRHLPFPIATMFLMIAFIPAFSEELAYRGIIQAGLLKIMHGRQAVVITALLFAIIHMSLISFIWLLPFALFLGWLRQRMNTLWYGVVIHFCFNATTCLIELYELGLV